MFCFFRLFFFFFGLLGQPFFVTPALSHHPLQDVEDADAVDRDEGGEVRRDVDPLQRTSRRIEGLQGLAFLHIPPLDKRQRKRPLNFFLNRKHCCRVLGKKKKLCTHSARFYMVLSFVLKQETAGGS